MLKRESCLKGVLQKISFFLVLVLFVCGGDLSAEETNSENIENDTSESVSSSEEKIINEEAESQDNEEKMLVPEKEAAPAGTETAAVFQGEEKEEKTEDSLQNLRRGWSFSLPVNPFSLEDIKLLSGGLAAELDFSQRITFTGNAQFSLTTFFSIFGNSKTIIYIPVSAGAKYYITEDSEAWFAGAELLGAMITKVTASSDSTFDTNFTFGMTPRGGYTLKMDDMKWDVAFELPIIFDFAGKTKLIPQISLRLLK
ncbi:MAG: hypothetical protein K9L24_05035 [Spirochaetia bacterium]|nr:hypothetical protein [Spirochaetia bacterium]